MNTSDLFQSASQGHSSPYQESMKMSMDGATASNPIMTSSSKVRNLKDINDTPKPVKKPIFTDRGKYIAIAIVLAVTVYMVYRSHKAKQETPTPQMGEGGQAQGSGQITEPSAPQPAPVDPAPSATQI